MRPAARQHDSQRTALAVLVVGGLLVLGLLTAGAVLWLRRPAMPTPRAPLAAALPSSLPDSEPSGLDPSSLLANARREASAWHRDAVLVSLTAGPLQLSGVSKDGSVEIIYAKPGGQRISGGAEASGERLVLRTDGGVSSKTETRSSKARVAPEPHCVFEDAWAAALLAGADSNAQGRMRYQWSEKHARPLWEVLSARGEVLRRLDGVTCSILTR